MLFYGRLEPEDVLTMLLSSMVQYFSRKLIIVIHVYQIRLSPRVLSRKLKKK